MDEVYSVTPEQITTARAAGWAVMDLNDNPSGLKVRGPNWLLFTPKGEGVEYAWTEDKAWIGLAKLYRFVHQAGVAKVMDERRRQDAKWGEQNHDAGKWSLILMEEMGEIAKSQLEGDRANYLTELVQAAAVLVAWIECEMRKEQ